MDSRIENELDEASNVLLVAPPDVGAADDVCCSLLNAAEPGDWCVVNVTAAQSPEERLQFLENHIGSPPPAVTTVIAAADGARSSEDTSLNIGVDFGRDAVDSRIAVGDVAGLADTLGFGIEMTQWLSRRAAADDTVLGCVHTLSDVLQQTEDGRAVELLVPVLERTARLDASVHYHLDPAAHDDGIVELLGPWFDAVVEVGPDGSQTIRRDGSPQDPDAAPGDPFGETIRTTIDNDVVFDLLSDHRRRVLLYALRRRDPGASVPVDTLVDRLLETEEEAGPSERADRRDRIAVDLRHRHLPRLADAGLVDLDGDRIVRNAWGPPLRRWVERARRTDGQSGDVGPTDADDSPDADP